MLIGFRESAQHREIDVQRKRKKYSLLPEGLYPVVVLAFIQQVAVLEYHPRRGKSIFATTQGVLAQVVIGSPRAAQPHRRIRLRRRVTCQIKVSEGSRRECEDRSEAPEDG